MALTLGLVQCENVYAGQTYLPLAIACLQACIQATFHSQVSESAPLRFLGPFWQRSDPEETARALRESDVAFFSVYAWNERWTLEVARLLKQQRPETLVVLGGPQVPEQAEAFLRLHPYVDLTTTGEGETVGVRLIEHLIRAESASRAVLETLGEVSPQSVPGLRWLSAKGHYCTTPPPPRLTDLSALPSPYLSGCFEGLLRDFPQIPWRMLLETNRGCPYSCSFCDWGSYTASKLHPFPLERVRAEIEWAGQHRIESIFVCDANFGILPRDLELIRWMRDVRERTGYPHTVAVQNAKVGAARIFSVWKALRDAGLNREAALPVQSTEALTLRTIQRINLPLIEHKRLTQQLFREQILTYSDVILGLPEEGLEAFRRSIGQLIAHGQHHRLQISTLVLLPNAELGSPAVQAQYGLQLVPSLLATTWSMQRPPDPLAETLRLVVGSRALPAADWVEARAFAWAAVLLHSHKVLQVPNIVLNVLTGLPYERLLGAMLEDCGTATPLLKAMGERFRQAARGIQAGRAEYQQDPRLGDVWLPPDDLLLTLLHLEDRFDTLYAEARARLEALLEEEGLTVPEGLVADALLLNGLWMRGRTGSGAQAVTLRYNLWELVLGELSGQPVGLVPGEVRYKATGASNVYGRVRRVGGG